MKKGILLNIFCLLFSSAPLLGSEVLARRLSISFQNAPIKEALDEVAKLAGFEWSYNSGILDPGLRVTFSAADWTVREILREMLGEEYVFKSNGNYLILKRQKPPKTEVSGVIRGKKSGERLANVTVYDRKTLRATTTDSSGYYQLKVKKKTELVVVRLGYQDTILQVASITPRYHNLELTPVPIPPKDSARLAMTLRKSFQKAASELDYFFATSLDKWHDLNVPDTMRRRFQISFLPKLGTNHVLSDKVENSFSINLLAGQSAGVRYFEAAGLGNFTKNRVKGIQMAGLFNLNRGDCIGFQAAGLYNQTADTLNGAQMAGLVNLAYYSPRLSLQAAGLANIIRKTHESSPNQKPPKCVQLAGITNKAHDLNGVQAAGVINIAQEVKGAQLSGLVNKASKIRGCQIGVFNAADDLKGLQFGLINRSGKRWLPIVNWGN
ncbi:MAG: LA_2272 family surface repeat-containing protein [Saprospiraceae bacterium]